MRILSVIPKVQYIRYRNPLSRDGGGMKERRMAT